jgi:pilus assembly protein TadC
MTPRAQDLLRDALKLPADERADLAAELIASLEDSADDPAEVQAAWAIEIEKRAKRVLSGQSPGELWSDVRRRVAANLPKR